MLTIQQKCTVFPLAPKLDIMTLFRELFSRTYSNSWMEIDSDDEYILLNYIFIIRDEKIII